MGPGRGGRTARVDHDVPGPGRPARRRGTAWPVAWCPPGWPRPAESPAPRRGRRAGRAARGRCPAPGWRRWPPRTCRTGRCSRSTSERSATRTNLPSVYAFSLVNPPPPNAPTLSGPYARWLVVTAATTRSRASSQPAWRSGLVRSAGSLRTSGCSSRSGWSSRSAAVQPLAHSPPRLVGNSVGASDTRRSPGTSEMPHCSAQYGQCVAVGDLTLAILMTDCFETVRGALHPLHHSLSGIIRSPAARATRCAGRAPRRRGSPRSRCGAGRRPAAPRSGTAARRRGATASRSVVRRRS